MECAFCENVSAAGEVVFETSVAWVLLHPDSAVAGHAMVVAKRHVENVSDLPIDEWIAFAKVQYAAERALIDVAHADRAILMKLGIQTPHLHMHIYPVSRTADRAAVMKMIDANVREPRPAHFAEEVRTRLTVNG